MSAESQNPEAPQNATEEGTLGSQTQTQTQTQTPAGDLSQPLYGASFGAAVIRFFAKYATFTGRASRSEFWWAELFIFLLGVIPHILLTIGVVTSLNWAAANPINIVSENEAGDVSVVSYGTFPGMWAAPTAWMMILGLILGALIALFVIVPQLALVWRRLHDANLPGVFFLLTLLPGVGGLVMLIFALLPPRAEGARFD